jgi:hypothetical protein
MKIPEGIKLLSKDYEMLSKEKNEWMCELQRALFMDSEIVRLRFSDYLLQLCLFTWRKKKKFAILWLYDDDILLCTIIASVKCVKEKTNYKVNLKLRILASRHRNR